MTQVKAGRRDGRSVFVTDTPTTAIAFLALLLFIAAAGAAALVCPTTTFMENLQREKQRAVEREVRRG